MIIRNNLHIPHNCNHQPVVFGGDLTGLVQPTLILGLIQGARVWEQNLHIVVPTVSVGK